jgi:general secretion pathway protein A
MYLRHFALTEAPFSIAPDPRYLYMSQRHKEALAHLLFGLQGDGGFVLLSGEVGAGKTTVCRCLLAQIPDSCDLAYVFNPKLTADELLATLCTEFGIALPSAPYSVKALVDALNGFLLAGHTKGRHAVLIIDEAQNLSSDVLEQMRLLTNLETDKRKLLQIILVGQPELETMLARPELRQLAQRVVARYHLDALSREELAGYIAHRLQVAGSQQALFPASLMGAVFRLTGGVPRLVNLLCDRTLLGAYVEGKPIVSRRILHRAAREVLPIAQRRTLPRWLVSAGAAALAAGAALLAWHALPARTAPTASARPAQVANTPPAAPAPAAATGTTTLSWPADFPREQSQALAFAGLYAAWGEAAPVQACAAGAMLRCRTARGGLDELHQFNRPALLYLTDAQGTAFHAVLLALTPSQATLRIANTAQTVPVATLAASWAGRYTLLWRAPAALPEQIRPKDSGAPIAWLAQQLALAQHVGAPNPLPSQWSAALRDSVKHFQLAHGLTPDGQVGAQTLIRLSEIGDTRAPRLMQEAN